MLTFPNTMAACESIKAAFLEIQQNAASARAAIAQALERPVTPRPEATPLAPPTPLAAPTPLAQPTPLAPPTPRADIPTLLGPQARPPGT